MNKISKIHRNSPITLVSRGFSLYEVMIVMAIICMITALLVPSYQKAIQMADRVKCTSNLRQWGIAFQLNATDDGGFYPLSWINNSDNWTSFMFPYVDKNWLSYNPTNFARRLDVKKSGCPYFSRLKNPGALYAGFPYSYNAGRFDYPYFNRPSFKAMKIWLGSAWTLNPSTAYDIGTRYGRYSTLYTGLSAGDSHVHVEKYANVPPTQLYQEPGSSEVMFCGWAAHWRYCATPRDGTFHDLDWNVRTGDGWYMGDYNQMPCGVHGGVDNYLMMDGHVESLKPKDPLVNFYVYNDVPVRGNPWRNFPTDGSSAFYPGGVIPKGIDPFP